MTTTTAAPPADQYYLYVIALSKHVSLAELIESLTERLGPLQIVELVTVPPITVVEWWTQLAAGAVIYPAHDNVPVMHVTGLLWRRIMAHNAAGERTRWDVYSVDIPGRRVCIYPDGRGIVGGLWVSPDDITRE